MRWNEPYVWGVVADDISGSNPAPPLAYEFVPGRTPADDVALGAGWNPMSSDELLVDPANGNLRYSMTDFALSGVARSVDVVRTYNSLLKDLGGGFGPGWSFGWDMGVSTDPQGATVRYPDGRHEFHGKNFDGSYARPIGASNVLTEDPVAGTKWRLTELTGAFYDFDSSGRLIAMEDTNGHRIESVWSGGGSTQTLTDVGSGRSLTFTWSAVGSDTLITEVATAPVAAHGGTLSWRYYYSGGRLAKACSPVDNSATGECYSYSYDAQGRLLSSTLPEGNVDVAATYVASGTHAGKAATQTDGEGNTWQFAYDAVTLTPPGAGSTAATLERTKVFDPRGVVPGDAEFNLQFYDFDNLHRLTHHDDRHGAERWYAFDADTGYLSQVSYSTGDVTTPFVSEQYEHDEFGNVVRRTDARGKVYETDYGPLNRVLQERSPIAGRTESYTYDSDGNKLTHANGEGNTATWTYTDGTEIAYGEPPGSGLTVPAGLMASMSDPRGNTTTYEYSVAGELRLTTAPTGATTEHEYDELGRVVTTTESWSGNVAETTMVYDELSRVVQRTEPAVANAITSETHQLRTTYEFDGNSNTISITESDVIGSDPDRTTVKAYDDNDREWRVTDPEGGVIEFGFDEVGNVTERTDQLGRVQVTKFDHASRPIRETLLGYMTPADSEPAHDVVVTERSFDVRGRLIAETDSNGNETRHTYNNTDQILATTLDGYVPPGGTTDFVISSYEYDDAGRLLAEEAGNGKTRVEYAYDLADRAVQETVVDLVSGHVSGNRVAVRDYDAAGNLIRHATTQNGRTDEIRYTYSDGNEVLSTTIEGGALPDRVTTFERSQRGHVVATIDPAGNRTDNPVDALGRPMAVESPEVTISEPGQAPAQSRPTIETGYDTFGNATHVTDHTGNLTVAEFDLLDRRISITHPSYTPPGSGTSIAAVETFDYDEVGNLVGRVDRRGHRTDYEFDSMNRVAIERQPAATSGGVRGEQQTRYDDNGNVVWQSRPDGQVATHTYDPLGRRTSTSEHVRHSGGTDIYTTTWTHDGTGNITSTTLPSGDVTTQLWSPTGKLVEVVDPGPDPQNLPTTTFTYDVGDRVLTETDPVGRSTRYTYDAYGQLIERARHDALGVKVTAETYGYDAAGNRTTVADGVGGPTTYTFDAANRLTGVAQPTAGGQPDVTRSYGYDERGLNTVIVDGNGNEWYKTYNVWGLLESETEPATAAHPAAGQRTFTMTYDAGGLAVSEQQPGGVTISRTFDDLGRLVSEDGGSAGGQRSFGYDLSGRSTSYSHPSGTIAVAYNDRDQITDVTGPAGASSFTYDANARMASRTDASGTTAYSWTSRNQLYGLTDPLTGQARTYSWTPGGELAQIDYGNQVLQDYTYDSIGRLASEDVTTSGSTTWSATYSYTVDGNVETKTIAGSGAAGVGTHSYTYDEANRLTSWVLPSATTVSYSYDGNGNRLSAGADSFSYDERNRLLSGAGVDYTWTPRGTAASTEEGGNVTTFAFDGLGRMTRAGDVDYTYDALDRIAAREGDGFEYSGIERQPSEDGTTTIARTPAGRVAALADGSSGGLHAISDRHGDLTATMTATGVLADSVAYDPFGDQTDRTGSSELMVGFQSHYTDPSSGLVDMGARWYRPWTATFMSRDRVHGLLETPVSLNRYTYANNNPLTYWDPDGRRSVGAQLNDALGAAWGSYQATQRVKRQYSGLTGMYGGGFDMGTYRAKQNQIAQKKAAAGVALNNALEQAYNAYQAAKTQAEADRRYRQSQYGSLTKQDIEDPLARAALATQIVLDYFKTFDVAKTLDPADANGDISPKDYRRIRDGDYPPELKWAAKQILDQGLEGQFHTKKSWWERNGATVTTLVKTGLSFVPVVGDLIDAYDCVRGDPIACLAAVPGLGSIANAAKTVDRAADLAHATDVVRVMDGAHDAERLDDLADLSKAPRGRPLELANPATVNNAGAPIRSFATETDMTYYRVYSGDNTVGGYLTGAPPRTADDAVSGLALPPGNRADFIQEVNVPAGTRLQSSIATEAFGQSGGHLQYELIDLIDPKNFGPGVPFR